ncbi:MAG TPA: sigma-70 family RNA polymerase sigma factor [Dongiaceae bacterium]|nr:sigma-70 family RNA polymerase sigma factor [Dongiaceae bacterium]
MARQEAKAEPVQIELVQLVVAIGRHDESAFNLFYQRTVTHVHTIAHAILRQSWLAQEVVCDLYVQVWENARYYDPERGSVLAWLAVMTRSRALDRLRVLRQQPVQQSLTEAEAELPGSEADDPLYQLSLFQQDSGVRLLLAQMPDLPRQVLLLSFFRGLSHAEIAAELTLPLGTVKSYLRRSLKQLRQALHALYGEISHE